MILRTQKFRLTTLGILAVFGAATVALAATPVEIPAPPKGKGQVVFYRKPMFSLIPFTWTAREGKTEVCQMVAGTYCVAPADRKSVV